MEIKHKRKKTKTAKKKERCCGERNNGGCNKCGAQRDRRRRSERERARVSEKGNEQCEVPVFSPTFTYSVYLSLYPYLFSHLPIMSVLPESLYPSLCCFISHLPHTPLFLVPHLFLFPVMTCLPSLTFLCLICVLSFSHRLLIIFNFF